MARNALLPVFFFFLLPACASDGPSAPAAPAPGGLPPNTVLVTGKPDLRPTTSDTDRATGIDSRLFFSLDDGRTCSAQWGKAVGPDPFPLVPKTEYRFLVTWPGRHLDMAQVVEIRTTAGQLLWRNPQAWSDRTAE
jgi:hypothetical protein